MDNNEEKKKNLTSKKKYAIIGGIVIILIVASVLITIFVMNKKSNVTTTNENTTLNSENKSTKADNVAKGDNYEDLIKNAENDEKNLVTNLEKDFETLKSQTDTYDKYVSNKESVKAFYDKIYSQTDSFGITLREYSLKYAELVMKENITYSDKYDKLDEIYDEFYDGVGDDIYDDIYDGLLDDMYDYYYDGILDDAYDKVPYKELSDLRSNEYKWCSGTRSDAYKSISNTRSDIYKFISNIRSKVYQNKEDKALEEIEDFRQDINKLKNGSTPSEVSPVENNTNQETTPNTNNDTNAVTNTNSNNTEIGTEFKNAMDSYESFMNEYVEFMKKYKANSSDMTLLSQYNTMLQKYAEQVSAFEKWKGNDLNNAETAYYIDVQARVSKKLLEVSN